MRRGFDVPTARRLVRRALAGSAAVVLLPCAAGAQALLDLGHLAPLASQAKETVDLTIPPELLQVATAFLPADDPNQALIKEMVAGLKGIYVKSFQFDRPGVYSQADVDAVHGQLSSWSRIVNVQEADQTVGVYLFQEGTQTNGLAVVVTGAQELTVVNIVGPIDLQRLAALAGNFGIPNLPLPPATPTPAR